MFGKLILSALLGAGIFYGAQQFVRPTALPNDKTRRSDVPDDKSIYMTPDPKAWPGDQLSVDQFEWAVQYFADPAICQRRRPWLWALIGPGDYLLKGTRYKVVDAYNAPWPNVHGTKGYWGDFGLDTLTRSVPAMKGRAEENASKDCSYGITP